MIHGKYKKDCQSIIKGIAINILAAMLLSMIISTIITRKIIGEGSVKYFLIGTQILPAFLGCNIAIKNNKNKLCLSIIYAISYYITILALNALLFSKQLNGVFETFLLILCGCILQLLVQIQKQGKREGKRSLKHLSYS